MASADTEITLEKIRPCQYNVSLVYAGDCFECKFFASEDFQAWLNSSSELQSLIIICHYYPAYDLEKAGKLNCLQIQILLQEFS